MSFVIAVPEFVTAAASDLARIGSTVSTANAAALAPTTGVLAAGADEVSAGIAAVFDAHAQAYQALSAQAAGFHDQFVQLMNAGAGQYAAAEAANASPLQNLSGPAANAGHNFGYGNTGTGNIGFYNQGSSNVGFNNTGIRNFGIGNTGTYNFGGWNTGSSNFGLANYGIHDIGIGLTGSYLIGIGGLSFTY
ncbi:PE-PGRS family protein [Mycobacterium bohemicum DSM 44277]|uniref:PE-PGRS family protein n=2 Tax=Mycobacterium bohemicum TaxID=56425 RepID=A0A0U0W8I5_MYCBE|nr:PE domain-containing protein [Mycobacterium bohemicum]CPR11275.1 PE-PGRS family protein [Mycobacterium bohemicum DSM 44277]